MSVQEGSPSIKVALVGEEKVGKTNLHRVLCNVGPFEPNYRTTVGPPRPHTVRLTLPGTEAEADVVIVDTAGQLRMRNYTLSGLPGSKGVWLIFDLTRAASFKQLEEEEWLRHIRTKAGDTVAVMLVGNKNDVPEDEREVKTEEARQWADRHGLLYAEVSAKDPPGAHKAFASLLATLNQH